MDRTDAADKTDWIVVKPFVTQTSNCILPKYVVATSLEYAASRRLAHLQPATSCSCGKTYGAQLDPITGLAYFPAQNPAYPDYTGFNPAQAGINNGEGFDKDLSGNELPNAPPFTVPRARNTQCRSRRLGGHAARRLLLADYSWARVFNDNPYDRLRGYTNVNLTVILTNQTGWQVMLMTRTSSTRRPSPALPEQRR